MTLQSQTTAVVVRDIRSVEHPPHADFDAAVGPVAIAAIGDIGVGVLLRAQHAYMARRGVRDPEAEIVTEPYEDRSRMTLAPELSSSPSPIAGRWTEPYPRTNEAQSPC
jgi:hypothetical protein